MLRKVGDSCAYLQGDEQLVLPVKRQRFSAHLNIERPLLHIMSKDDHSSEAQLAPLFCNVFVY